MCRSKIRPALRFARYRPRLGADPVATQKRVGNGFVEQRLVADQVGQLTGRRFLAGYADDEAQYIALMDAGVSAARTLHLAPGVALTDKVYEFEQTKPVYL